MSVWFVYSLVCPVYPVELNKPNKPINEINLFYAARRVSRRSTAIAASVQ
jgi:hypothetical protein